MNVTMSPAEDTPVTVLIVDDEREMADLFAQMLSDTYAVKTAYTGEQALETVDDVDVVLLDRRLPDISGDEVLQTIRERDIDCRVVMVTAVEPSTDIIELGVDDYVIKPVSSDDLRAIVEEMVTRASYVNEIRKFLELRSKKSALERSRALDHPRESEQYADLERRLSTLREELDHPEVEYNG